MAALTTDQPIITTINTGSLIAHIEPVCQIRAYARIYVALSEEHSLGEDWNMMCDRLDDMINLRLMLIFILVLRKTVLERVKALRARLQRTRTKRGLFKFIGELGSSLFGIPSASDMDKLA